MVPATYKYTIRLTGPRMRGAKISGQVLRDLLEVLTDGTRGAVRLFVEGRSTARGARPEWLDKVADFVVTGLSDGSTQLALEVPSLSEAAPEEFAQREMWRELDPSRTAVDFFSDSLQDATRGAKESDLYDESLLGTFCDFERLLHGGVERISVHDGKRSLNLGGIEIQAIRALQLETPSPQRVFLAARLDAMRFHDRVLGFILESGAHIKGVAEGVDPKEIRGLLGDQVLLSGLAVFRPSGSVLRIEVDGVEPAKGDLSVWTAEPRPIYARTDLRKLRRPQTPLTGLSAAFGQWPGDETDEEIFTILEELS